MSTGDQHRKYIGNLHEQLSEVYLDPLTPVEDCPPPTTPIIGELGKGKASQMRTVRIADSDESRALVERVVKDARDKRPDIR